MPITVLVIDLFERAAWVLSRNYVALMAVLILALLAATVLLIASGQQT